MKLFQQDCTAPFNSDALTTTNTALPSEYDSTSSTSVAASVHEQPYNNTVSASATKHQEVSTQHRHTDVSLSLIQPVETVPTVSTCKEPSQEVDTAPAVSTGNGHSTAKFTAKVLAGAVSLSLTAHSVPAVSTCKEPSQEVDTAPTVSTGNGHSTAKVTAKVLAGAVSLSLTVPKLSSMCARMLCGKKSVFPPPGFVRPPMQTETWPMLSEEEEQLHTGDVKWSGDDDEISCAQPIQHGEASWSSSAEEEVSDTPEEASEEVCDTPEGALGEVCDTPEGALGEVFDTPEVSVSISEPSFSGSAAIFSGTKRKQRYRRCPIPQCGSKPQLRLPDHIRLCHPQITPRKRKRFCIMAKVMPKGIVRPIMGQRRLTFTPTKHEAPTRKEDFPPIFEPHQVPRGDRAREKREDMTPGRKGSTRGMASFPSTNPKIADFIRYLTSVQGGMRSESTARDLAVDVSKILFFCHPGGVKWASLLDRRAILSFFEQIRADRISPSGRLTKMERLNDALKYMRFSIRESTRDSETSRRLDEISAIEESLAQWKTVLHRDKRRINASRLVRTSNTLPSLESINEVLESVELVRTFQAVVTDLENNKQVSVERLRYGVAAVCVPLMYGSSSRPGAVANLTMREFDDGRWAKDLFIATCYEHKTNMIGPCKLVFDTGTFERAIKYKNVIRPWLTVECGDIPEFFVLPGSKPIEKMSNMTRIIKKNLGLEKMPTATEVRKMGSTAVAKNCEPITRDLVARQFNHDSKVSAQHYQATMGDQDAALAFRTVKSLRNSSRTNEDDEGRTDMSEPDLGTDERRVSLWSCSMSIVEHDYTRD